MTIPKEVEFKEYVDATASSRLNGQMDSIEDLETYEKAEIKQFIDAVLAARGRYSESFYRHPVRAWIEQQPTSERAYATLFREQKTIGEAEQYAELLIEKSRKVRTIQEYREFAFYRDRSEEDLREIVKRANGKEAIERRIRDSLKRFMNYNPWRVESGIAQAFSDYFYSERFKKIASEVQSAKAEATKIKEAISTLRAAMEERSILPRLSHLRIPKSFEEDLDFVIQAPPDSQPIRRLDNTARERCLAFDLWRTFFSATGKGKPRAIWYFMEFEGVKNQADMRELERRTKRWKAATHGN